MTCKGGPKSGWASLWIDLYRKLALATLSYAEKTRISLCRREPHLIVDESPLFQEGVNPHDGTDVSGQIPSTRSDGEVFTRPQSIGVDHKVPIFLINRRRLAPVLRVEELG